MKCPNCEKILENPHQVHNCMVETRTKAGKLQRAAKHRGTRCGRCYWALYDGDWCQNPECVMHGKSNMDRIFLTNEEAAILIKAKGGNDGSGTRKV